MKKSYLILIAVAVIIAIAIFTNPDLSVHKEAVKTKIVVALQKSIKEQTKIARKSVPDMAEPTVSSLFGEDTIEKIVDKAVSRDSYLLFSITKVTSNGKSNMIVGIGAFGGVYISNKINEVQK